MKRTAATTIGSLLAVGLLAACSGSPAGPGTESGAQPVSWRLALNQTNDHPITLAVEAMADRLAEATDGRVKLEIYPNETLGTQPETLQLLSDNTLELAVISGPQLENLNTDFAVFNSPFVFDDIDHQMKVINDLSIVGDLYASLEASNNATVLGGFTAGERSLYQADRPVTIPADTAGLKIRVQESATHMRMIELMGGSPTPMGFGEVYTALQSGVLDGAENNEVSYVTQKHYEVAPHFSYTRHLIVPDYVVASTTALSKLSAEDRELLMAELAAAIDEQVASWQQATADAIETATAAGATFNEVDADAFRTVLEPLLDETLTTDSARSLYEATRAAAK